MTTYGDGSNSWLIERTSLGDIRHIFIPVIDSYIKDAWEEFYEHNDGQVPDPESLRPRSEIMGEINALKAAKECMHFYIFTENAMREARKKAAAEESESLTNFQS